MNSKYCSRPFTEAYVGAKGEVCIPCNWCAGQRLVIGNLIQDSFETIWNSQIAKNLREDIIKEKFECNVKTCQRNTSDKENIVSQTYFRVEALPPISVRLATDFSCNLCCPSCRAHKIKSNPLASKIYDSLILPREIKHLSIGLSGEVFASPSTIKWLSNINSELYPNLKIWLQTNGQLLFEKWDEIKSIHNMFEGIGISIDAATKRTYEKLRAGAKWEKIIQTMEFTKSLQKDKKLDCVDINFVVQRDNFREIPAFVELGVRWEVANIFFQRIRQFTQSPIDLLDVGNPNNPDYQDFTAIKDSFRNRQNSSPKITWDTFL
jgi:MoaA/NifB/PqqE/SkfB family radical SAM enzyme